MRWQSSRRSENVEDQRRQGIPRGPAIGGGLAIIILLVGLLLGGDPAALLETIGGSTTQQSIPTSEEGQMSPADETARDFVAAVLGETEDVWRDLFARNGGTYHEPRLVLFSGSTESACGYASAATGPFYCSADQRSIWTWNSSVNSRTGSARRAISHGLCGSPTKSGIMQNLLGIMDKVNAMRERVGERDATQLSVRLELQADFLCRRLGPPRRPDPQMFWNPGH
jgi:predicted metalloprotease